VNVGRLVSEEVSPVHYFISDTGSPNVGVDITKFYEQKVRAIKAHKSQIYPGDMEWVKDRHKEYGDTLGVDWAELFYATEVSDLPPLFKRV
jgi:LmbE family N-acetylglucosaminyl deacetylase